ncbi:Na/Pi cotransporter family protein [Petroclostridium sp. X23]|uniref:Na/Pi cotransporter family protein n=1 Tax=Petroclostridium sp. X23 TaxID=3045146 RepID=UPI0024AC9E96|nr:Na/Pi cotransporter family protein [Petroclostridium sp. X23]WHH60285.1 Na/Pi cotransporter family protein [Petroclostridium sp. X23]
MSFIDLLTLFGGLGLFLYGMKIMGDGLEQAAGERMQKIIEAMTSNLFKSVIVGTVVTALVQSSSATTVMVVGFVNAGVMKLTQAVGVIMGANIGTTVTSQIIRLGDIDKNVWYLMILKPKTLAPLAIALGVAFIMFSKKKKLNNIGAILAGFGILFIGMGTMESAVEHLRDLPQFKEAFVAFRNPILGVLIGAGVTAVIQSSSASVGILQAVASTGLVTFSSAIPIILGQNIGTCVTALLSSIGANKNAKKAAMIHLFFNTVGTGVFLVVIYTFQNTVGFSFWNDTVNRGGIADFHTVFNIANTVLLLPFAGLLVKLAHMTVRGKEENRGQKNLDERFLTTPSVAVSQTVKEVIRMSRMAQNNVLLGMDAIMERSTNTIGTIDDNENAIDEMESNITQYLIKIADEPLSKEENKLVSGLFHVITDIERIGDHAVNLGEMAAYIIQEDIEFSELAKQELTIITDAVKEIVDLSIRAYESQDVELAKRIQPCEDVIDLLKETLRVRHIDRLSQQKCSLKSGVIFLDIVNNLERIADHCSNIGIAVEQLHSSRTDFDPHEYLKHVHQNKTQEYRQLYDEYESKYGLENS